jgi:hypothetical protein
MEPAPCTEVIAVTEPHDWPLEQPAEGTLRPWYLTATGHLMVLFSHPEQAQRARSGLLEHGVSQEDIRLYESEEILRILARAQKERSILARPFSPWPPTRQSSNESWTTPAPAAPPSGWLPQPGTVPTTWSCCWPTTAIRSCATTATMAWPTSSGIPASAPQPQPLALSQQSADLLRQQLLDDC